VTEGHAAMIATLSPRVQQTKKLKTLWTENGGGTDSKGVLAVLAAVVQMGDIAVTYDFVRNLPTQRDDFFNLDLCNAMLPIMINLLNHTEKEDVLYLGFNLTHRLVKLFGNLIKTTRDAPTAKGVDLSKEERLEKCQTCYNNLVTIQHLAVNLIRHPGTVGKNAKDLSNLLRIYLPDV
jgi:katanin p80 WD40 repeat-containing subunit B1